MSNYWKDLDKMLAILMYFQFIVLILLKLSFIIKKETETT